MTLVALIVTTFLMPQPAGQVTVPVAATWSSGAPAGLSAAVGPIRNFQPAAVTIAPMRLPPVGSGLVATIGFAALSLAMVMGTRQRKEIQPWNFLSKLTGFPVLMAQPKPSRKATACVALESQRGRPELYYV